MFADPLVMPCISGAAVAAFAPSTTYTFVCIGRGPTSSTYRYDASATHWIEVFIGHQQGKRNRYTIRLTESEVIADPIDTTRNSIVTSSAYAVVDRPVTGATSNQVPILTALGFFLCSWTNSAAPMIRVLGGET